MAFQQDRKTLLSKNEKLQKELESLKSSGGSQAARSLKKQLVDIEAEREQMLSEHGSIAAEMQQRYAKERMHAEKWKSR
uniref:Uncharacterized protein n=1 Tax=Ditylenchus dipsaci TaxID=166011 RepID=A0A915E8T9_9BILA